MKLKDFIHYTILNGVLLLVTETVMLLIAILTAPFHLQFPTLQFSLFGITCISLLFECYLVIQGSKKCTFSYFLFSVVDTVRMWLFLIRKDASPQTSAQGLTSPKPSYLHSYNKAARKVVLINTKDRVTLYLAIPNDEQAYSLLKQELSTIRSRVSNSYSAFSFSDFEERKHYFILKGTR
ncbi:hypothetical protein [Streptococcus anginosus]|uniref:hypothetical protein n=1 Tax=Streptococcus anginosus TaxID=1328 RepID=UPI0012FC981A|nr:hypothetical protein [Streptococcus anginosus]